MTCLILTQEWFDKIFVIRTINYLLSEFNSANTASIVIPTTCTFSQRWFLTEGNWYSRNDKTLEKNYYLAAVSTNNKANVKASFIVLLHENFFIALQAEWRMNII